MQTSYLASDAVDAHQTGGKRAQLFNPGDLDEIIAEVITASPEVAKGAVDSAQQAFSWWAYTPMNQRIAMLDEALEHLERRDDEVARQITVENGKPLKEARNEMTSALRDARFQLDQAVNIPVREFPSDLDGTTVGEVWHEPVGVFLLITPWNFPLATVLRKLIPALVWGNTAIVKPAEQTPLSPTIIFDCLHEAGLPDAVAQMILGSGPEIGSVLVAHPAVAGISFTGSTEVGLDICRKTAGRPVRLQMEMGGKNAMVVLKDADMSASVEAAMIAAFTCSGQWCTSTSRVIVEDTIYEPFCRELVEAVSKLRLGPGFDPKVNFGPVASRSQMELVKTAITTAKQEGGRLLCGGATFDMIKGRRGYFVEPTVFADVTESMELFHKEIFGPVLGIIRAGNADEALRLANATPFGLSFSVFTADTVKANQFLEGVDCGMVHHNMHTAYRHPALPITGWKESGRGLPECGQYAREFYTQTKTVYRCK